MAAHRVERMAFCFRRDRLVVTMPPLSPSVSYKRRVMTTVKTATMMQNCIRQDMPGNGVPTTGIEVRGKGRGVRIHEKGYIQSGGFTKE